MNKIGHNNPPLDPKETIQNNINRKKPILDRDPQFFESVPIPSWIELSLIDVCNRSCDFCPKSDESIAPNTHQKMSMLLIEKLVNDLKKINFEGAFCLCGYGEPMLHKNLINIESVSQYITSAPSKFLITKSLARVNKPRPVAVVEAAISFK